MEQGYTQLPPAIGITQLMVPESTEILNEVQFSTFRELHSEVGEQDDVLHRVGIRLSHLDSYCLGVL